MQEGQWQEITVRNTDKGGLTGFYHFVNVWIWNKAIGRVESRLLVIRKTYTPKGEEEIKFSFILVSSFILKEKLLNKEEIPLLSAKDVKELVIFQLYKQMPDEQMYHKIIHRHIRQQKDINNAYLRQNPNLSKLK